MILFESDWVDAMGRTRAIPHVDTPNTSFKRMVAVYQRMGVKNSLFSLALTQPDLAKYDPHHLKDPSNELRLRIVHEARVNPWYYIRECIRVPIQGSDPIPFQANRGYIALAWLFYNSVDTIIIMPRQTGKTFTALIVGSHVIYLHGKNVTIQMITYSNNLVQENVSRLRSIRDGLPNYFLSPSPRDTDNKEGLRYDLLNNKYSTFIVPTDRYAAQNVARGLSSPLQHFDEPGYTKNISIAFPVVVKAATAAVRSAKANGKLHGNIYTTTAARLDTESGTFAYQMVSNGLPFTEKIFDCPSREDLQSYLEKNSLNNTVNCTFSYLQLGYSHEWFRDAVRRLAAAGEAADIDRDFLNMWKTGTEQSILGQDILDTLRRYQSEPRYIQILHDSYTVYWYVDRKIAESTAFKKKHFVLGMDSSEQVGRDFTALVLVDPETLGVVATFRCNEDNITQIGVFIGNFLLQLPNTIFIPERKSTGLAIIDTIKIILTQKGHNPFKRIYNALYQNKDTDVEVPSATDLVHGYNTYRKHLGFTTTGKTRDTLYKIVLTTSMKLAASKIQDQTLVSELCTLSVVNGRVDHESGKHDDMVIAYLLACWFVLHGRNFHLYGFDASRIISADMADHVMSKKNTIEYRNQQIALRQEIARLKTLMDQAYDPLMKQKYNTMIRQKMRDIDPEINIPTLAQEHLKDIPKYDVSASSTPTVPVTSLLTSLVY